MSALSKLSVLCLAGQRSGIVDPLASAAGVSHKCLVPLLGQSLIGRVLSTVERALPSADLMVSIESPDVLENEPTVARLKAEGRLRVVLSRPNLVDSVKAASESSGYPLLITTADNALLTADALQRLAEEGGQENVDAILVVAAKEDIEAAHPGGKGRYYEFRDGSFSNCNLFWLKNASAMRSAETFREGGQFLKVAGRMIRAFGVLNVLLYRLKVLTLPQAFRAVSRRLGVQIRPLVLSDGRLAIDADDQRSMAMVEEILRGEATR